MATSREAGTGAMMCGALAFQRLSDVDHTTVVGARGGGGLGYGWVGIASSASPAWCRWLLVSTERTEVLGHAHEL